MRIDVEVTYVAHLKESERWDFKVGNTTINVKRVHISFDGKNSTVLVYGRRRLKNGSLSVQDPEYMSLDDDELPAGLIYALDMLRRKYDRSVD